MCDRLDLCHHPSPRALVFHQYFVCFTNISRLFLEDYPEGWLHNPGTTYQEICPCRRMRWARTGSVLRAPGLGDPKRSASSYCRSGCLSCSQAKGTWAIFCTLGAACTVSVCHRGLLPETPSDACHDRGRLRYVRNRPWVDVDVPSRGLSLPFNPFSCPPCWPCGACRRRDVRLVGGSSIRAGGRGRACGVSVRRPGR